MAREEKLLFIEDKPLLQDTTPNVLATTETKTYNLADLKSDAKYLRLDTTFTLSDATKSNYRPQVTAKIKVVYANIDLEDDIFYIVLNRDLEVSANSYKNTSQIQLQGNDISTIDITITNKSTFPIELLTTHLYQSKDLSPMQLVNVLKEPTIAADVFQATTGFTEAFFTQLLVTNALSRDVRRARVGDEVEYIEMYGNDVNFFVSVLGSETEQFNIKTSIAGVETTMLYWYAIIEGPDAYKYITTVDPRTKYSDISDSDRDKFKLMVYKPSKLSKKMWITFAKNTNGNWIPTIIYGEGTSSEEGSMLGRGATYKDENGFYHVYQKADGSGVVGIVMSDSGVHIIGWADQHCEFIKFKDNGLKFKFAGEEEQKFEYVINEENKISAYIQNGLYLTTVNYEPGLI